MLLLLLFIDLRSYFENVGTLRKIFCPNNTIVDGIKKISIISDALFKSIHAIRKTYIP